MSGGSNKSKDVTRPEVEEHACGGYLVVLWGFWVEESGRPAAGRQAHERQAYFIFARRHLFQGSFGQEHGPPSLVLGASAVKALAAYNPHSISGRIDPKGLKDL